MNVTWGHLTCADGTDYRQIEVSTSSDWALFDTIAAELRLAPFGSVLRGQPGPDSDVDILVQFAPGAKSYGRFLALSELLEARLGRPVELVTPEALSPFIGLRILAEAQDILRPA